MNTKQNTRNLASEYVNRTRAALREVQANKDGKTPAEIRVELAKLLPDKLVNARFNNFNDALKAMPASVAGNYDTFSHKTLGDLAYIAQHELDMFREGQETDIKSASEAKRVMSYRDKVKLSEVPLAKSPKGKSALIIVDVQNDFTPGSALAVPDGYKVVSKINTISNKFDVVVATQDWHPANQGSFAGNYPGRNVFEQVDLNGLPQTLWPAHSVQGTKGAELHPGLDKKNIDKVFQKGTDPTVDSYSGFYDNGHRNSTGLAEWLKSKGVSNVYVAGLATDYCCKFTALDAAKLGFKTHFIEDASKGVNIQPDDVLKAIKEMTAAGVSVTTTAHIDPIKVKQPDCGRDGSGQFAGGNTCAIKNSFVEMTDRLKKNNSFARLSNAWQSGDTPLLRGFNDSGLSSHQPEAKNVTAPAQTPTIHALQPTLEGRLSHPLTSRAEAVRQLQETMPITPVAQAVLDRESESVVSVDGTSSAKRENGATSEIVTIANVQQKAKVGGEVGANGEWYEGGKWIATTDHAKSHKEQKKATGKQEIEPYKWEVPPDGKISLYRQLAGVEIYDRNANKFTFNPDLRLHFATPEAIESCKQKIEKYNAGERWAETFKPTVPNVAESAGVVANSIKQPLDTKSGQTDGATSASILAVAESLSDEFEQLKRRLKDIAELGDSDAIAESVKKLREDLPDILKQANEENGTDDALENVLNESFFDGVYDASHKEQSQHVDYSHFFLGLAAALTAGTLLKSYPKVVLKEIGEDLVQRSSLVSKVLRAELLGDVVEFLDGVEPATTASEISDGASELIRSLTYDPKDEENELDLANNETVQFHAQLNSAMADGFGKWKCERLLSYREQYPCFEFYRAEFRKEPRDWPTRWSDAGGSFYPGGGDYPEGRMIAPAESQIWLDISRFNSFYPPYDYNSGMDREPLERNECIAVGAIDDDWTPAEQQDRRFNVGLGFNPRITKDLLDQLGEDMGTGFLAGNSLQNNRTVDTLISNYESNKTMSGHDTAPRAEAMVGNDLSVPTLSNSTRLSVRKKPVEAPKGVIAPQDEIIPITAWQQGSYPVDPPNTVKSDGPGIIPKNVPPTEAELNAEKEGHDKQRKLWQEANDKLAPGASSEPSANKRCGESGIPDDHTCHLETGAAKDGVIAYHGTPYNIKGGFDESKIGTGEGNESYGHGLYFAEEREVAEVYRKALTKAKNRDNDASWTRYLIGINGEKPRP